MGVSDERGIWEGCRVRAFSPGKTVVYPIRRDLCLWSLAFIANLHEMSIYQAHGVNQQGHLLPRRMLFAIIPQTPCIFPRFL